MELFPTSRVVLSIGSLQITWYAVLILTGAIIAYLLSERTMRRWGYKDNVLEDFFVPMLFIAIIGARIYYVIFEWNELYAQDPIRIFYIWEGGLAIHGGLIAGIAFGAWYFHRRKINGLRIMDAIFPNVLIAQAMGRWGNFINQEAFGGIVSASYYDGWPDFIKECMLIDGAYRQPTFLYESVANLLGFVLITFVYKRYGRRKRGDLAWAYFAWYGVVRFWIESMRTDALMAGNLRVAQLVSLVFVIVGIGGILGLWNRLFARFWPFRKEKPAILFDLDGTLIDSRALVDASFRHTMEVLRPQVTLTQNDLDDFFGPPLSMSFRRYFSEEAEVEEAIRVYRKFNVEQHDAYVKTFAGTKEVLEELKKEGYPLAVVSNKKSDVVRMGIAKAGLEDCFSVVLGGDELERPKPDPQGLIQACRQLEHGQDDVIYVGDSRGDIEAAKAMAAFSVALVQDPSREEELAALKPCALLHDIRELSGLVKEEREWSDPTIL